MKELCITCSQRDAVWFYPSGIRHYCDGCVPREGCSCYYNEELEAYDKDELGRDYPCVDYMYFEDGVDQDDYA